MEYISKFRMVDSRWLMVQDTSLTMIDTIMTLLLLVKIINLFANFLISSDRLLFKYFSLWKDL